MIVHKVKLGKPTQETVTARERKKIYVGSAESDIRYRDMLVAGRHRWELYSKPAIDFLTLDRKGMELAQYTSAAEKVLRKADGVMILVSGETSTDPFTLWEIEYSLSNSIPTVGVDIRPTPKDLFQRISMTE